METGLRQVIPLITSAVTLLTMWLAGSKKSAAWLLGIANQGLWAWFIIVFEAWGLIPLSVCLTVIYARNYFRWRRDQA